MARQLDHFSFADAFRFLREARGLSARALSAAIGLSPAYISKMERMQLTPSADIFAKMVVELGCSEAEIFFLLGLLSK